MKFLKRLKSFFILFLCLSVSGQEIFIVDEESKFPLEGVALYNKSKTSAIITNQKGKIFSLNEEIKSSIFLKLFVLPFFVFLISKFLIFDFYQSAAVILQAGTPTAISTILMAEAYNVKQKIASKILFTTTLISIITIPLLKILINAFK